MRGIYLVSITSSVIHDASFFPHRSYVTFFRIFIGPFGVSPIPSSSGYGIGAEHLTSMTRDHALSTLQDYGGVSVRNFVPSRKISINFCRS